MGKLLYIARRCTIQQQQQQDIDVLSSSKGKGQGWSLLPPIYLKSMPGPDEEITDMHVNHLNKLMEEYLHDELLV